MDEITVRKHSVALAIRIASDAGKVLLVRRPDDDAEFPGMWGLPAATCKLGETHEDAAVRLGEQKLGVNLQIGERIGRGSQSRGEYLLMMNLYDATIEGNTPVELASPAEGDGATYYTEWRWGEPDELLESASRGSLCSQLLLEHGR